MKHEELRELFIAELEDTYSAEKQIIAFLPSLIKSSSMPELTSALSKHLQETQDQVGRLESIFSILRLKPKEKLCKGMKGILSEAESLISNQAKTPVLDAAIIGATQKVEHYEIASYGTLRSFAKHLDLESKVATLLQTTLDEEGAADKTLTKIAEGSLFSSGINKEAAAVGTNKKSK